MVSLTTILIILAGGYWFFYMGGQSFIMQLFNDLKGGFSSTQTNSKSNVSSDGNSSQSIFQSRSVLSGNNIPSASDLQSKVNEMLKAQGIDMNQPNINIQKRDDRGNNLRVQKNSGYASSLFASGAHQIRAF